MGDENKNRADIIKNLLDATSPLSEAKSLGAGFPEAPSITVNGNGNIILNNYNVNAASVVNRIEQPSRDEARVLQGSARESSPTGGELRKRRINGIHARSARLDNGHHRRISYMIERFGETSLMQLNDAQLEEVYLLVRDWGNS